ncbi:endoglucanase [Roseivivax lentus]|uniref:cellulase n=1 Tax=Roseivivax lentus TaxID=633194 RepID=A0A1N7LXE6_9RHOB|nr:endoglucanase [Roseivivax lentus]
MLGTSAFAGAAPLAADPGDLARSWASWAARFLQPDGRVVDPEQGGVSHSEGQAYALLSAQAAGDREAFERIERWTREHLLVRDDALMAWRWTPGSGVVGEDWHNATDGDLFRAWALLRAARDSGWDIPAERYTPIVADLSALCLWPDPRDPAQLLLRPGAEAFATADRVLINPSYIMPRALRDLGHATGDDRLIGAADHGVACLSELAGIGLLPDWIDVTSEGYGDPTNHDLRSAYDALRIPLYLAWSGHRDHAAVRLARAKLAPQGMSGGVAVARDDTGQVVSRSDLPGYLALRAFLECKDLPPVESSVPGPYYPAVLHLLATVAKWEVA